MSTDKRKMASRLLQLASQLIQPQLDPDTAGLMKIRATISKMLGSVKTAKNSRGRTVAFEDHMLVIDEEMQKQTKTREAIELKGKLANIIMAYQTEKYRKAYRLADVVARHLDVMIARRRK